MELFFSNAVHLFRVSGQFKNYEMYLDEHEVARCTYEVHNRVITTSLKKDQMKKTQNHLFDWRPLASFWTSWRDSTPLLAWKVS